MLLYWTPLTPPNVIITTLPVHHLGMNWTWLSLLNYITKDAWRFHSLSAEDGDSFIFEMDSFSQSFLLLPLPAMATALLLLSFTQDADLKGSEVWIYGVQLPVWGCWWWGKWVHSKRGTHWKKVNSCRRVVSLNEWEQLVGGGGGGRITWPPRRRMVAK